MHGGGFIGDKKKETAFSGGLLKNVLCIQQNLIYKRDFITFFLFNHSAMCMTPCAYISDLISFMFSFSIEPSLWVMVK